MKEIKKDNITQFILKPPCLDILDKYEYKIILFTDTIIYIEVMYPVNHHDKQVMFSKGWKQEIAIMPGCDREKFSFNFLLGL